MLRTLSLATNKLTDLPHTVSAFTQLKTLALHHNLLTTLPSEFGAFSKLEALNISFVCLSMEDIHFHSNQTFIINNRTSLL